MTYVRPDGRATDGLLPLVPHRLHGREEERRSIRSAFERVRRGAAEVMLLTGPAGIGKSALAEEFGRSVGERGAVFARGWFDPFHSTPLSGFRHALGQALAAHMERPAANRAALRELLHNRLGDGVGVIAQLVSGLEQVVGALPEPPPAPASDEQNRFRLLMGRFTSALASADRPLVLLLDDLQWAEPSSVELLSELVRTHSIDHTLILGGFRCERDGEDHPLLRLAADPPADGMPLRRITLDTLDRSSSRSLVADALQSDSATVAPLSDAVSRATGGNPLALLRFLGVLRDQAVLRDGDGTSGWAWDMQQVEQQALGRGSR
ncbi:MAG: AAA family ATPase, partial [Myxococcota bacterium]|nr:AAA family ATPase [Myxococcota bacterium]